MDEPLNTIIHFTRQTIKYCTFRKTNKTIIFRRIVRAHISNTGCIYSVRATPLRCSTQTKIQPYVFMNIFISLCAYTFHIFIFTVQKFCAHSNIFRVTFQLTGEAGCGRDFPGKTSFSAHRNATCSPKTLR